jgi:hypothetical protein
MLTFVAITAGRLVPVFESEFFRGKELAVHTKHYRMKVVAAGEKRQGLMS